jgi:2,3-bisphosphoglycerate-independent phosphoglycerate mutase
MFDSVDVLEKATVNRKRLSQGKLPANMIWLWGQGRSLRLPSLRERFGLTGGVISAVDLMKGIGVTVGLRVINVPGATGYLDTNYSGKAQYALDALRELDLVYLHVEAPDEAAHNADLQAKIRAIEQFDHQVVGRVLEGLSDLGRFRIMVLPDHRTPLAVRTHTREPVPVAIFSADISPDDMLAFTEAEAEKGSLKIEKGHQLIQRFIGLEG